MVSRISEVVTSLLQSQVDAQRTAVKTLMTGVVNVLGHGAVGDGVTDDAAAIRSAIAEAWNLGLTPPKIVYFPPGNYLLGSQIVVRYGVTLLGAGSSYALYPATKLIKGFNGDMVVLWTAGIIEGMQIFGNGATYTGTGINIVDGGDQRIRNSSIWQTASYGVHYTLQHAGIRSTIHDCFIQPVGADTPAIKLPDNIAETNGNRQFSRIWTGGRDIHLGKSANVQISMCEMRNVIFTGTPTKTALNGNRIASAAADITISGYGHAVTGNVCAGRLVLALGTTSSAVTGNVTVGGTQDDSGEVSNYLTGNTQ